MIIDPADFFQPVRPDNAEIRALSFEWVGGQNWGAMTLTVERAGVL